MSEFDKMLNSWKSSEGQSHPEDTMNESQIKGLLRNRSMGITSKLLQSLNLGVLASLISSIIAGVNIYGYSNNPIILPYSIVSLVLSLFFMGFIIGRYRSYKILDESNFSLLDLLTSKVLFFKKSMAIINHFASASLVLMVTALNLWADNENGEVTINSPFLYFGVLGFAYLLTVSMLSLTHKSYLNQLITALDNLDTKSLIELDIISKKSKRLRIVFVVLIIVSVLGGVLLLFTKL